MNNRDKDYFIEGLKYIRKQIKDNPFLTFEELSDNINYSINLLERN